jgi:hypothetical protein
MSTFFLEKWGKRGKKRGQAKNIIKIKSEGMVDIKQVIRFISGRTGLNNVVRYFICHGAISFSFPTRLLFLADPGRGFLWL